MYELIILSLLARFPAHGYLIAKIINDMIGPYAKISNGRLYPLLAKLEESGLIEANEELDPGLHGERNPRCYRITEEGRERFHALMVDTTSSPGEYQRIFKYKVPVFYLLQPFERLYLIDHYINYCQTHVLHITAEAEDLSTGPIHSYEGVEIALAATLDVMQHMVEQWRMDLAWAQRLRAEELDRQQGSDTRGKHTSTTLSPRRQEQKQNQNQNPSPNRNQQ